MIIGVIAAINNNVDNSHKGGRPNIAWPVFIHKRSDPAVLTDHRSFPYAAIDKTSSHPSPTAATTMKMSNVNASASADDDNHPGGLSPLSGSRSTTPTLSQDDEDSRGARF